MKNISSYILTLATVAALCTFTSCKKCYQCTVLDEDDNAISEYQRICGTKTDFENYKESCEATYGSFGYECSCGEVE